MGRKGDPLRLVAFVIRKAQVAPYIVHSVFGGQVESVRVPVKNAVSGDFFIEAFDLRASLHGKLIDL